MTNELKEAEVQELHNEVSSLTITDDGTYKLAGEYLVGIKGMLKRVDEMFDGVIAAAHKSHKAAVEQKKKYSAPMQRCEMDLKQRMGQYQDELRRRREEEEYQLRLKAVEETARLTEQKAVALVAEGRSEEAAQVMLNPPEAPAVYLDKTPPKVDGVSVGKVWDFAIENPELVPREFCVPDEAKIRAFVRAMGGTAKIAGVKVYDRTVVRAGSR